MIDGEPLMTILLTKYRHRNGEKISLASSGREARQALVGGATDSSKSSGAGATVKWPGPATRPDEGLIEGGLEAASA